MKRFVSPLIRFLENTPITPQTWLVTFLAIIAARLLTEHWVSGFSHRSIDMVFVEFSHTFLFFLFSYFIFLAAFMRFLGLSLKQSASILLWGFLIILTPPILDHVISGGQGFWSFYKFDGIEGLWKRYFTFFGDHPEIGITYGVRIEVALATLACAAYAYRKKQRLGFALVFALLIYSLFFFLGTLPSWFTIATRGFSEGWLAVSAANVAQDFISPLRLFSLSSRDIVNALGIRVSILLHLVLPFVILGIMWRTNPKATLSFLRNVRPPQIIYHAGLFFLGCIFALIFAQATLPVDIFSILAIGVMVLSVIYAWIASIIVNDFFDISIDTVTNTTRPLIEKTISSRTYSFLGAVFFAASLLTCALVFPAGSLLLLAYQAIAWAYSAPPLRLKRFPLVATLVSAVASLLILLTGFFLLAEKHATIGTIPTKVLALLLVAYTIALPLKDFKDIAGDKKDKIYTLPVLLGEKKARLLIASGVFACFIASVMIINNSELWIWALVTGLGASWTILTNARFWSFSLHDKHLPWGMLAWVVLYGIAIVLKHL